MLFEGTPAFGVASLTLGSMFASGLHGCLALRKEDVGTLEGLLILPEIARSTLV